MYVTDSPDVMRALVKGDPQTHRAGEANAIGDALPPLLGPASVLLADGDEHLRQRRLLLPSFHGERMRAYGQVMAEATRASMGGWPVGRPFGLRSRMQDITLDIILRTVFGVQGEARLSAFREAIGAATEFGADSILMTPPFRHHIGRPVWRRFVRARRALDALVIAEIAARRDEPPGERDDILSMLIAATFDDGTRMTDWELRDELVTLLVAGHETTATALAWTFELLFRHPAERARLEAELATGADRHLKAVIQESLRVRPVVVDFARLVTVGIELGGFAIPAGSVVTPSSVLVNTNAAVYDDPQAFRPERFLDTRPGTYESATFGGGVRRCLGASFAQYEMEVVLREVLTRTHLRPARRRPERAVLRTITMTPSHGASAILGGAPSLD
jgi:cytochrome P450